MDCTTYVKEASDGNEKHVRIRQLINSFIQDVGFREAQFGRFLKDSQNGKSIFR